MLDYLTIADSRYLNPQTSDRYVRLYCRPRGLEPKSLEIDSKNGRAVAHWIGDPDAEAVILYCHGGAYTQPANAGNFRYLAGLVKTLNNKPRSRSVSVLWLAYTLAPESVYPTQLREAAVVLAHLIRETGRSPSEIFIAGDSAGGNLAFSLLSHLLHPQPDVPAVKLECPLGGVLLISPWVSFRTDYISFKTNATLDMLTPLALRKWGAMFLGKVNDSNPEADPGPISGDSWTEACLNPPSWWNGMPQVVSDAFVWSGAYEVLNDSIRELEKRFMEGWATGGGNLNRVRFFESAREAHVAPIVDIMIPGVKKSDAQIAIEEWFKGRLQR
ncbi:hydrolase [Ascochyta rabiei]|uniref:Hydrolase n=1 Tax=Didymella rabiei TaxID=5454 RepID=A0A163FDY8_DIDRA|nr:hydrolase [Ascochyta rabiei]